MPLEPYKLRPVPPVVALLSPEGAAVSEHGEQLNLDAWPAGVRLYASYDTVYGLVRDGHGEALCWNREEIRWRHRRFDDPQGWRARPSDAHVIRLPFDDERPDLTLRALAAWRDWLAGCGASPVGTTGSAAWSLLRASLDGPLWLRSGALPPLRWTCGGRIENGRQGAGRFDGKLTHLDLSAAYARELGGLRYGGRWHRASELGVSHGPEWWALEGRPVFVRAIVRVPESPFGLLLRRPRKPGYLGSILQTESAFPRSTRLQGVWTWQELEVAAAHGATIVRVLETWVHFASGRPFLPWWEHVERGRSMPGLAGLLAKVTGNALWGRFAMDVKLAGDRHIRARDAGGLADRKLPRRPGLPADHALAETVSGRVRARLTDAMVRAGDKMIAAHTDGFWFAGQGEEQFEGWRPDKRARRLDLVEPMVLRWWPQRGRPRIVFAGQPASVAEDAFERAWSTTLADDRRVC